MRLHEALADLPDDTDALEATLASRPERLASIFTVAMALASSRPRLVFRILKALTQRPAPSDPVDREHWLRAHNNACYFAISQGDTPEKLDVVERALHVAPDNVAIYHNAACLLCQLGEGERAIQAIREGIARGYDEATIKAIADDPDLDLIRHTEAFQQLIRSHGDFVPPSWAAGWTAWEVIQFREDLQSSLDDPGLGHFDEGRIVWRGREFDIVPLAQECKRHPASEWGRIVLRHFLLRMPH